MATRTLQRQEREGTYMFCWQIYTTAMIAEAFTPLQINAFVQQVRKQAKEKGGLDYLQIFKDEAGNKIYFIDNLTPEQVSSGQYNTADHYATLMFAEEY